MFFNITRDILGIGPRDGKLGQITSYGKRDEMGGWRLPGAIGEFQDKCVDIGPRSRLVLADMDGPAVIVRFWMAVPRWASPGVLKNLVLRMYYDGEDSPSVLAPIGDFFGTSFGYPREYVSAYTCITSGGYNCYLPTPFSEGVRIEVENQSRLPVPSFFYQLTYLDLNEGLPEGVPYLHASWRQEDLAEGDPAFTILEAMGEGFYLGCNMDMQGTGFPWSIKPVHNFLPSGGGMGILEGWERIWIDGGLERGEPNTHGTGGEEYFGGAWYFTSVPSTAPGHGVMLRRYDTRRVSCYRFHLEMPVWFNESIRVTIDHGLNNSLSARYAGTAYWYQREPHGELEELPPPSKRRPRGALKNTLYMSVPVLVAEAILKERRWRKGRK